MPRANRVTAGAWTAALTAVAMVAFAANSLLARLALAGHQIGPAGFTGIRLLSGAAFLGLLLALRRRPATAPGFPGDWPSAASLLVYALAFSLAYVRLGVALGALVLFTTVQVAMILWGALRDARPSLRELLGAAVALAGFVYLVSPGLVSPDPAGSVLMVVAGVAWAVYSLRGRAGGDPLRQTAGHFIRTAPVALPLALLPAWQGATGAGIGLALASGIVASGLGYVIWYRALPRLAATQAAVVQLTVPVIAALGAVLFLSEALTLRLVVAGAVMLGGVAIAIVSRRAGPG